MSYFRTIVPSLVLGGALIAGACQDPAKDAPKAEVREAAPTPAAQPTAARPSAGLETIALTAANTEVAFVGAKVTGKHDGGFKQLTGELRLDAAKVEASALEVQLQMDSLFSDNPKLTGHLKAPDFFDVAKFPTARFVSTSITAGGEGGATHTITGNLTMRDVTKAVTFPATVTVTPAAVTAKAEFGINRKDWGIVYPGKPDDLIADNVLLKLSVNGQRTASPTAAAEPSAAPTTKAQ